MAMFVKLFVNCIVEKDTNWASIGLFLKGEKRVLEFLMPNNFLPLGKSDKEKFLFAERIDCQSVLFSSSQSLTHFRDRQLYSKLPENQTTHFPLTRKLNNRRLFVNREDSFFPTRVSFQEATSF